MSYLFRRRWILRQLWIYPEVFVIAGIFAGLGIRLEPMRSKASTFKQIVMISVMLLAAIALEMYYQTGPTWHLFSRDAIRQFPLLIYLVYGLLFIWGMPLSLKDY